MFSKPEGAPEIAFLKIGLIDDREFLDSLGPPKTHFYCKYLLSWEKPFEGAKLVQN